MIVHWLQAGLAVCGLIGPPAAWPPGHVWVSATTGTPNEITCGCCRVIKGLPVKRVGEYDGTCSYD